MEGAANLFRGAQQDCQRPVEQPVPRPLNSMQSSSGRPTGLAKVAAGQAAYAPPAELQAELRGGAQARDRQCLQR